MASIRLTNEKRDRIMQYMLQSYVAKRDDAPAQKLLAALIKQINTVLRARYPEKDMKVLRKYSCHRKDTCLNFAVIDTGRYFEVRLSDAEAAELADIASRGGCFNRESFPCSQELADIWDEYEKLKTERRDQERTKRAEYRAFVEACKTLADVEAVVPLPEEVRKYLGATPNSLVILNEDTIASIRAEFAQEAA